MTFKNGSEEYTYIDNDFDAYVDATKKHVAYPPELSLVYLMAGLGSEVGEVLGKYKKWIRDCGEMELSDSLVEDIRMELGDVLWYIARIHDELGLSLYETSHLNIQKLNSRVSRGVIKGDGDKR